MIIVLSGLNSYLLQQDLSKLVQKFLDDHGELALERIDCQEAELPRIEEAITSLPFLASRKMVVLRSPSANKQFVEKAERLLATVNDTTDLVIVEPKLDKRSAYFKFLKKSTDYREFTEPDVNGLAAWLIRSAKEQGGTVSSNDARFLVERVGVNQQLLANELNKLLLHNDKITRDSITLLTDQTPQSTIFQLLEAAFAGNAKRALNLYQEQRLLKVEAPQIVAMLAWQLHIIAIVKAAGNRSPNDIAKEAKLSPFVVQKSATIAHKLSLAELKDLIDRLLDIDIKSKRTNLDTDEALQHYFLRLALRN